MIAIGVDHNHQDDFGYTCVHYAALKNNYEAAINILNIKLINLSVSTISRFALNYSKVKKNTH